MVALRLTLVLALLLVIGGCNLQPAAVWVYVDNTGDEPVVVWIDGQQAGEIAAGKCDVVKCQPGEHEITVKSGDVELLQGKHELKSSEQFMNVHRYVLDPRGQTRYAVYKAEYGDNPFKGMFRSAVMKAGKSPINETQLAYMDLLKQVQELPADNLVDVEYTQYILTDPPESVTTKGSSAQRTVLTRIDPEDHAFLRGARQVKDPTIEDVEALADVVKRIMFTPQDGE
jgi:hypothetical protein